MPPPRLPFCRQLKLADFRTRSDDFEQSLARREASEKAGDDWCGRTRKPWPPHTACRMHDVVLIARSRTQCHCSRRDDDIATWQRKVKEVSSIVQAERAEDGAPAAAKVRSLLGCNVIRHQQSDPPLPLPSPPAAAEARRLPVTLGRFRADRAC